MKEFIRLTGPILYAPRATVSLINGTLPYRLSSILLDIYEL